MNDDQYRKIFSRNLRRYMSLNDKNQTDLIRDLGFNKSAVSTWCNGTRLPRMDKVDALAKYFNIKRSDLIEDRTDKPSDDKPAYAAEETTLINKYRTLNEAGQDKVNDYIDDLASSEKYRKSGASSSNTPAYDPSDRNASEVLKNINDSKIKPAL